MNLQLVRNPVTLVGQLILPGNEGVLPVHTAPTAAQREKTTSLRALCILYTFY